MCVCVCVCVCVRACARAVRIISKDTLLRFINTFTIIIIWRFGLQRESCTSCSGKGVQLLTFRFNRTADLHFLSGRQT